MTEFTFTYDLEDHDHKEPVHTYGPLFTHWLPEGEKDAIQIKLKDREGDLLMWFERCGILDNRGFLKFDYNERKIEENWVHRQGVLDAGPIRGKVILAEDLPPAVVRSIIDNTPDDSSVIDLIKPIVKEITATLISLTNILRYRFGQYWIPAITRWDSRNCSIGVYCKNHIQLKLRIEANNCVDVVPGKRTQIVEFESPIHFEYPELLTEDDWTNIRNQFWDLQVDTESNSIILKAHEYYIEGDHRMCVVMGCTALELAIDKCYQLPSSFQLDNNPVQAFYNLPLRTQATCKW